MQSFTHGPNVKYSWNEHKSRFKPTDQMNYVPLAIPQYVLYAYSYAQVHIYLKFILGQENLMICVISYCFSKCGAQSKLS